MVAKMLNIDVLLSIACCDEAFSTWIACTECVFQNLPFYAHSFCCSPIAFYIKCLDFTWNVLTIVICIIYTIWKTG